MKTGRTTSEWIRLFGEECATAFRFLEELGFRRAFEADTRIGDVRYSKLRVWVLITYDVLDRTVVAYIVRRRLLRRQVTRFGWIELPSEDDLAEAVSKLASAVRRDVEEHG
jgi:hypothetical protein